MVDKLLSYRNLTPFLVKQCVFPLHKLFWFVDILLEIAGTIALVLMLNSQDTGFKMDELVFLTIIVHWE